MNQIKLSEDTITKEDMIELSSWLLTTPRLTKGDLTEKFEKEFAEYIGKKYSVFVNSGSSALLLMLAGLIQSGELNSGDTIVVPNVSWSTDASSVLHAGLKPIFCDCNIQDLSVDLTTLESIFIDYRPKALLLVEVLGLVPRMSKIVNLCNKYNVILLEDACESLGSEYNGNRLGSFGYASVFSTYFGHHISTIEGGLICTDNHDFYNILKSMRSHGWDRDLTQNFKDRLHSDSGADEFKSRFLFYYPSFNFRSTDLQAFIGLGQMKKLENINFIRRTNFNRFVDNLRDYCWTPISHGITSNFAYPVISKNRSTIVQNLEANGIETRPLICGDMETQPYIIQYQGKQNNIKIATTIDNYGFYIPNHPDVSLKDVDMMCEIIKGAQ